MIKKKHAIPALAVVAVMGGAMMGSQSVNAQGNESHDNFATKFAEKFNLSQDEVKSFMEESREERKAEREARQAERLNEAVSNGDLTEAQKQLLVAKQAELKAEREAQREARQGQDRSEFTDEERETMRSERETKRDEIKQWAEDNGIDMKYLNGGGKGHRGGMNK